MSEAWVTSAVEEDAVDKAIILAGSLRRVCTTKHLVVFTTLTVSEKQRARLKMAFDLVLLLEQESPNGLSLEDHAKMQAFSLMVFKKCVYLSPNALVLNNCDDMFQEYKNFAAGKGDSNNAIDCSVFVFVPTKNACSILGYFGNTPGKGTKRHVNKSFTAWLMNNVSKIEELNPRYNSRLDLKRNDQQSFSSDVSIVNFIEAHPIDLPDVSSMMPELGLMEKLVVEHCTKIYTEDIQTPVSIPLPQAVFNEPIAIVGMSFRLPGGNNPEEFWSLLKEGRSAIGPVPAHRWTKDHSYFPCKDRNVEAGFLNIPVDGIDAKFFGLSPKEAEFLDPQQRLLLELTWEALEDAMIDPLKLRGTQAGVFVGSWIHDYKDMLSRFADVDFFRTYMGNSIASTAARLSHFLESTGPSIATESGCSSAIAAVDMACKSLRNGDSSLAVAAGVNLLLHPFDAQTLPYVISPDFRCKTFDASANGFARAEACAVLVLKRLSDAVKDGDNMWGLIRGTALTQEGTSKSLGTPTVHSESLAMELALEDSGVDPKDVSYVEAHGTGTSVGDPLEILAITKAYSKGRIEPLLIGSVKTNVGHTESVSGITGMIKVLLSMKHEMIPEHLNLEELNPNIKLDAIPAHIPLSPVAWPKQNEKRRLAGVSSFGISGTDGHAIIEEPPLISRPTLEVQQERPLHIIKFCTKSPESMDELINKYLDIFKNRVGDSEQDFANFAYSANVGRCTLNHRTVLITKDFKEAARILEEKSFKQSEIQFGGAKLCFLFTGQGSQYPNMAKGLYHSSPVFKDHFERCDRVLQRDYNISIKTALWSSDGSDLNRTLFSQTSIFVVEYCLLKLWESWGVKPDFVMGHSLGEFAAAVAVGALNFQDAIKLVAERSRLIDSLPRGKMLVIKADKKTTDNVISSFRKIRKGFWVDYAALNSPEQTVVAGDGEMIEEFSKFCGEQKLKTVVLASTHAFHSRHMDPMLEPYRKVASTAKKLALGENENLPKYISGMDGKLLDADSLDADYWVRHTREKVSFIEACRVVQQEGCTLFLELGPHPILSALAMLNMEGQQIACLPSLRRKEGDWETILGSLAKLYLSDWNGEIDWKGFDKFYKRDRVQVPFYPFNRKPAWAKIERELKKLHPLIGRIVPSASSDTIFQNSISLKNASFALDHVIGNTIIFPGAAFLEMCLVGAHSTVQGYTEDFMKPRRPVILKALKIASPLALCESGSSKVQTLISLNDKQIDEEELGYSVAVHRLTETEDGPGKWIEHASAKFLPMAPSLPPMEAIDVQGIRCTWKQLDTKDFYEKLPQVGLRFGPKFQSLQMGWISEKGFLASVKVPEDLNDYLIHPIIADAMIQAIMLWTSKEHVKRKLQVPVQVKQFLWLKQATASTQFVYCSTAANSVECVLTDENGCALAHMTGVDFIETTAKLVEGMITQQSSALPKLWKDVWKNCTGPMQGSLTHQKGHELMDFAEEDLQFFLEKNTLTEDEIKFYKNQQNLTRLAILKALYLLGWNPEVSQEFTVESLVKTLNIKENFRQYIRFFLRSMAKEGFALLTETGPQGNSFKFRRDPPTMEELQEGLGYITSPQDLSRVEYRLIMEVEKSLSRILTGEVDPLSILFPNDATKASAEEFYARLSKRLTLRPLGLKQSKQLKVAETFYSGTKCRPCYRVLEIGAGTGVYTRELLDWILADKSETCDLEYYFTDVSAAFFNAAEKTLADYVKHIVFKRFDMEKDPLEQGFCPGYFDAVAAAETLHIAKDIKKTLRSVRSLLKPGGLILIMDTIYPDERVTFNFGLLEGYWTFEDREFRKDHTILTPEMWEEALIHSGFCDVSVTPQYNEIHGAVAAYANHEENTFLKCLHCPPVSSWLIFGGTDDDFSTSLHASISNVNRKCVIVPKPKLETSETEEKMNEYLKTAIGAALEDVESIEGVVYLWSLSPNTRDQKQVSLPFLTLMKLISELKVTPRVFTVTRGVCPIESSDVVDPTPGTLTGFCKSIMNENLSLSVISLDLDPSKGTRDQTEELFMNLWVEHKQSAAFRDGLRLCPKLTKGKVSRNEPLQLPSGCDRFQLILPKTKVISDLEFAYLEPYSIGETEVEVQVKAMALNFRDVFAVLKPIPEFEEMNNVGLDFAGVIVKAGKNVKRVKVGDRVMGMLLHSNLSLPSHYMTGESSVLSIPQKMTFCESVTLPAVFSTAVYCLINVAKMEKGETVLIHTASGGVGLVAIQLCKHIGANVIATAGSTRKRTYLRNLGIKHVFHSRTTDFREDILRVTEGRGVDIVLNSITGPGFKEASLDVLCKKGRFIEMSKLNTWTVEEVKALRPDVFYEIVDLTALEHHQFECLTEELGKFMKADCIKPIPYERFDALNIRGALNYLQKAKHIGKIVCVMPEFKLENSKLISRTPLFNEDSTYLVTGGLGGIGYEVVKWILGNGGKHVAIVSRSVPNPEIASQIETWNRNGKHVRAFPVDVGNYEKCMELFEELKNPELGFPTLRGVMHAAGVLQDAVFENQTWDTFLQTYKAKVDGSWNLHDLTKECLLEHFVLFSSMAASIGSPGQSNHSASNAFEDSLAAYRRSNGLPATCVNWGNWGEVGIATEVDFPGVRPISTAQGLSTLETFLKTQTSHMCVLNVDSFALFVKLFPQVKHYVDDSKLLGDTKASLIMNTDEFWNEIDSGIDRAEKVNCFKKFIKTVVRNILKMDPDEPIDDHAELQTLGIDSLMMLEMKNGMQNILGTRMTLTASQLKDCNTTEVLATTLVDILEGDHDDERNLPTHDEFIQLIRDDSNLLPEHLSVEKLNSRGIDQVERVVLTGATGNLGPYLLRELTRREQVKQVICLVRPKNKQSGLERLKSRLERMEISTTVDMSKVEVVEGDITLPKFGLDEDVYLRLCEEVDAIVHSAVRADHTANYWSKSHIRTVNVLGTVRLLEFAAERRVKHFLHASTMFAFTGTGKNGEFSEGWQHVSAFDGLKVSGDLGYVISKHICEQLVHQAIVKGIPCKAFRFPHIAGDSETGRVDYEQSHAILRWMTCMKVGAIHDLPVPFIALPVDHCARVSVEVFFNPAAPSDVYNMVQKCVEVEQCLVEVANHFGISLEMVSYDKFIERLKVEDKKSPVHAFANVYVEGEQEFITNFENPSLKALSRYLEDSRNFLDASKLTKYVPYYEDILETASQILIRDFKYLKEKGVFEKYKISFQSS